MFGRAQQKEHDQANDTVYHLCNGDRLNCHFWGLAQARPTPKTSGVQIKHIKYDWLKNWAWTAEKWNDNDTPFLQIQINVDRVFADDKNLNMTLQEYQKQAQQKPLDTQAQFRWGYLAYRMANNTDYSQAEKILDEVRDALANAPSPHVYSYSRLRFLTEATMLPFPKLKELGKRLLGYVVYPILCTTGKVSVLVNQQACL